MVAQSHFLSWLIPFFASSTIGEGNEGRIDAFIRASLDYYSAKGQLIPGAPPQATPGDSANKVSAPEGCVILAACPLSLFAIHMTQSED
jgi:hypothetical protein